MRSHAHSLRDGGASKDLAVITAEGHCSRRPSKHPFISLNASLLDTGTMKPVDRQQSLFNCTIPVDRIVNTEPSNLL